MVVTGLYWYDSWRPAMRRVWRLMRTSWLIKVMAVVAAATDDVSSKWTLFRPCETSREAYNCRDAPICFFLSRMRITWP